MAVRRTSIRPKNIIPKFLMLSSIVVSVGYRGVGRRWSIIDQVSTACAATSRAAEQKRSGKKVAAANPMVSNVIAAAARASPAFMDSNAPPPSRSPRASAGGDGDGP